MNTPRLLLTILFLALMGGSIQSKAEDIDLYSRVPSPKNNPNVLIILDNNANSDNSAGACNYDAVGLPGSGAGGASSMGATVFGNEQCAIYNVINALPTSGNNALVNVGIMVYNNTGLSSGLGLGSVCPGNAGGCLIQPLTPMTTANKTALMTFIKGWTKNSIKASNEATASAMQEAWAYFAGQIGLSGRDYSGMNPAPSCVNNYVVFIGNAYNSAGTPGDPATPSVSTALTNAYATALATYNAAGGAGAGLPPPPTYPGPINILPGAYGIPPANTSCGTYTMGTHNDSSGLFADEWARFMHTANLYYKPIGNNTITTYTIGVIGSSCKPDYPALLTSMATHGGGKYFAATNAADIYQSILRVINEVQAVNSVFSASSLPVSVNTQGTYLNQIYIGMFRPDQGGNPRWYGNLKQYQFIYNPTTKTLALGDAAGFPAISAAGTGFLDPSIASFWTCANSTQLASAAALLGAAYGQLPNCSNDPASGFWINNVNGIGGAFDLPDGDVVEKGGHAQMLRLANLTDDYTTAPGSATNPRNLYTYCPAGGCTGPIPLANSPFDTSNTAITDAMLGTGPLAISQITSMQTPLAATGTTPGVSGVPITIKITALAKAGNTVTATVTPATDVGTKVAVGTLLKIATGATKFDCNPCTVATVNATAGTFTYTNAGGNGAAALPSTATVYENFVTVTSNNPIPSVGQLVTLSGCTTYNNALTVGNLNGTVDTVTAVTANSFTLATTVVLVGTATDLGCAYTPNIATVTTAAPHGFPSGATVTIAGAAPAGYNGTWTITSTGTNTFTYQYAVAAPLANFAGAGATATNSAATRDALTKWVRGMDNLGDEAGPGVPVTVRPSIHGDVLHSRPVVLNYGGTSGVAVFYGGNDGVFRAIDGNPPSPSDPAAGQELWGFIPPEFFGKLKRLHDNSPALLMPSTPAGIVPTPRRKDYFVDGPTGVYQTIDVNGITTKAIIYLTMRRGGRFIYALDVTNPKSPVVLWRHSNTDAGFGELGQTWSLPKVAKVTGWTNPVLIFGAGYSPDEDNEAPTADTMGRGIFILDAFTGNLVWSACSTGCSQSVPGMTYSIPSDLTLVDRNNDGAIDRLYATDVGGNVWRVDLEPPTGAAPANWQVNKLAALGCNAGVCPAGTTPRKFLYPVEVITTPKTDYVFVASGDREHPLYTALSSSASAPSPYLSSPPYAVSAYAVTNRAYLLKDMKPGMDGSGQAVITEANLFDCTACTAAAPYAGQQSGYYITMMAGEKSVNAPLVVAGFIYFGTNQAQAPNPNKCEEGLGEATGYRLSPFTGVLGSGEFENGGMPPSPVAGIVNVTDPATGKTYQVPFCLGCGGVEDNNNNTNQGANCGGESALAGCRPPINVNSSRSRTYWYRENK